MFARRGGSSPLLLEVGKTVPGSRNLEADVTCERVFDPLCSETRLELDMEPGSNTDTERRLDELRATVRRYQDRYGELEGLADLARVNSSLAARRRRLKQLAQEHERIGRQMRSMASEVERIGRWLEFCLEDVAARAREAHAEGWSPSAVLGYRLWAVRSEGLHGVKMPWQSRRMTATCLTTRGDGEIPHTDGRCGRLGCGVYAAKTVDPLYRELDLAGIGDVALGLVALTGKVVEHDSGYRGAEAEVIALAASTGKHLLLTADRDRIDEVFADPALIRQEPETETERHLLEMETFVEIQARRAEKWTLGINSA